MIYVKSMHDYLQNLSTMYRKLLINFSLERSEHFHLSANDRLIKFRQDEVVSGLISNLLLYTIGD
jgi:hypothetical protein